MNDPDPATASEGMQVFIGRVRANGGPVSEAETEVLARATLRHLGERISHGQAQALTGALPEELSIELTTHGSGPASAFDKDTFVDAVSGHIHATDADDAERQVHAVLSTVRSWAPDGQVEKTMAQLPAPLAAMFA